MCFVTELSITESVITADTLLLCKQMKVIVKN
jgi:hypothetical protein